MNTGMFLMRWYGLEFIISSTVYAGSLYLFFTYEDPLSGADLDFYSPVFLVLPWAYLFTAALGFIFSAFLFMKASKLKNGK